MHHHRKSGVTVLAIALAFVVNYSVSPLGQTKKRVVHPKTNIYGELRTRALSLTPEQLKLSLGHAGTVPYGVVMEMDIDKGTATLVALSTGDASLYLSSGGGVVGGFSHQNVAEAAKRLVNASRFCIPYMHNTRERPLPAAGKIHFYVLTNQGLLLSDDEYDSELMRHEHVLNKLFEKAQDVLTALREVSQQ